MNIAAAVVVLAVLGWLLLMALGNVREVDVVMEPESLYPDGTSESVVEVRFLNIFGGRAWDNRTAAFRIVEGEASGTIISTSALAARVRATHTPGTIVIHVHIENIPLPYEVRIPVRRSYAVATSRKVLHTEL